MYIVNEIPIDCILENIMKYCNRLHRMMPYIFVSPMFTISTFVGIGFKIYSLKRTTF
jgi:hypothetical protein